MEEFGFQWHLTDRCNLRCRHCYQDDFSPRGELGTADLDRLVQNLLGALEGVRISINLTGGEPFLYPHLERVIDRLESSAAIEEFNIITNATVLPDERLVFLARQKKLGLFKVSLESSRAETNDSIRGPGNLEKVTAGIRRLIDAAAHPVAIMMTLARWNLEDIGSTVALARELGACGVIFERFVPLGTGGQLRDQTLDAADWLRAVGYILEESGLDCRPQDLPAFHAFWLNFSWGLKGAACNLGSSMALMPDGTVFPCRRLPLELGNALGGEFSAILRRIEEFRPGRLKERLTGLLCSNCPLEDCAGCRALAAARRGDWLADDPRCPLELE